MFNFSIYGKIFKTFTPVKVRYCCLDIFHICLTVIPNVIDISWMGWNADVNRTKDNIMVTFNKDWNINSIIWNCILVRTKWKVNAWHFVIYNMLLWVGLSIIRLHPADDVRESISWRVDLEIFCHHLEQRALNIKEIHDLHCLEVNQI